MPPAAPMVSPHIQVLFVGEKGVDEQVSTETANHPDIVAAAANNQHCSIIHQHRG